MTAIILHPDQERILSRALRAASAPSARAALTLDDGTVLQCIFSPHPLWGILSLGDIVEGVDDYMALKGHITRLDFAPPIDLHPAVFRVANAVITECGPLRQWHTTASYWVKCAR